MRFKLSRRASFGTTVSCRFSLLPVFLITLLLSVTTLNLRAQSKIAQLESAYNALINDPQAKYALTSLCVLDANTGKVLFARNENVGVATASTLKTITAATAFSLLGKDFTYQTSLAYSGKIDANGTLKGDLILIGSGDPTLGSWRYEKTKEGNVLEQWVSAIKKAGIKKIEGTVIGDDSLWPTQSVPEGWIWQDIGNYYGAGTSALTWRENQFDIKLKPGKTAGDPVTVLRTVPATPYIKLTNELKTGSSGSGDNAYAFIAPYTTLAYIRGTWGLDITKTAISASIPDPAFDAAYRLQDTLNRIGLRTTGEPTTARRFNLEGKAMPTVAANLLTISSPPLSDIIYWFCKESVNLYGETLLKTLAYKTGKPATTKNGAATVIKYWAEKGIDENALNIIDGSGLSPGTRVTTMAMANVLFQAQHEPWFADYYKAFPENNGMKLKSGSINDVSAYAGYYTDAAGNKYIVVININNYNGGGIKRKLFKALDALK